MKRARKRPQPKKNSKPKAKTKRRKWLYNDLKPIDLLAKEQGITRPPTWEELYGAGKDLWDSDEEFDEFLKGIYERRQRGR